MHEVAASITQETRAKFFERGELPVDEVNQLILRSWLRCVEFGLDQSRLPGIELPNKQELNALLERYSQLRRLCRPELDALNGEARDTSAIVILTNAQGIVLDTIGDVSFAGQAAEVALRPGALWSETSAGTNAIGTALAERRPVTLHGKEHFFESHQVLTCAAMPIVDPRGVVIGALDLSAHSSMTHLHALGLIRLSVEQIEHRFFNGGAFHNYTVLRFHTDPAVIGATREGLLVFDDRQRLIAANRRGLSFVQRDWSALDATTFEELFETAPNNMSQPTKLIGVDGGSYYGIMNLPLDCHARPTDCPWDWQDRCHGPSAHLAEHKLRDAAHAAMRATVDTCEGNFSEAARRLGVHRSTLYRRLNKRASSEGRL